MFVIETQIPYGKVASRSRHKSRDRARIALSQACAKASKQKGFVVVIQDGKEVTYAQLRADTMSPLY